MNFMSTVLLLCVLRGSSNYALARCVLLLQHHPIFLERLGKLDGVRIDSLSTLRVILPYPLVSGVSLSLLQHHPIFLERLGKLDGVRIEKEGIPDETILNYHLREMEYMAQVRVKE